MKKIALFLAMFLVLTSFTASEVVNGFNLVGKWTGTEENNAKGSFIFDEFGYATMFMNGAQLGGKNFEFEGKKASLKYVIDQSVNPITLDFIVTEPTSSRKLKIMFLIKIINNNTIVIASEDDNKRPSKFTKDNSMTFKRE